MRIDSREINQTHLWQVFDKTTGKDLTDLHIVAADDSTGQIVRYESKNGEILSSWPLISEIRDIELVYMGFDK